MLLRETNLDTRCSLEVDSDTYKFSRLFIAMGGSINGFLRCRPMLSLDVTFLKSKFKGTSMVAIGKDGNDGIVNAFCVFYLPYHFKIFSP